MKVDFKTTGVTPQREVLLGNKSYCNVTSDRKTVIFSVVNDAFFSVSKVWKPGSKKNLNDQEFLFNYRFTRERYVTENITGIWIDRFRIFANRATFKPDKALVVVMATLTPKDSYKDISLIFFVERYNWSGESNHRKA